MILAQAISIETVNDETVEIQWTQDFTSAPLDIHLGMSPESIDMRNPVARAVKHSAQVSGLTPNQRYYFKLCPRGEAGVVIAQRNVALVGSVNFRDLGGYLTTEDRRVKWGRLYRSGHLSKLTAPALDYFSSLDIRTVCDFRIDEERAQEAMDLPNDPQVNVLGIPPGVKDRFFFHRVFRDSNDPEDVVAAVHEVIVSMVDQSAQRYRGLFEVLLAAGDENILINCSAGKERTGVASALLLTALGVPRETIYYDFMLSKIYFPAIQEIPRVLAKYEIGGDRGAAEALVMPLLDTRASYLQVAFDFIDDNYGDALTFLRQLYDIGPAELTQLRSNFTT
jgi:protein-tyrosine phosphatase